MLKALTQAHEFSHGFALELLDVLVLLFELAVRLVLERPQLQRFVSPLVINLLLQVVLAIVNFLHDVLLPLDPSLHLTIELILETYRQVIKVIAV